MTDKPLELPEAKTDHGEVGLRFRHAPRFESIVRERIIELFQGPRERRREHPRVVAGAQACRHEMPEMEKGMRRTDAALRPQTKRETVGSGRHLTEHQRDRRRSRGHRVASARCLIS